MAYLGCAGRRDGLAKPAAGREENRAPRLYAHTIRPERRRKEASSAGKTVLAPLLSTARRTAAAYRARPHAHLPHHALIYNCAKAGDAAASPPAPPHACLRLRFTHTARAARTYADTRRGSDSSVPAQSSLVLFLTPPHGNARACRRGRAAPTTPRHYFHTSYCCWPCTTACGLSLSAYRLPVAARLRRRMALRISAAAHLASPTCLCPAFLFATSRPPALMV